MGLLTKTAQRLLRGKYPRLLATWVLREEIEEMNQTVKYLSEANDTIEIILEANAGLAARLNQSHEYTRSLISQIHGELH